MKNLKLGTKIIGGFIIAIVMMGLVMGMYQFTVNHVTAAFKDLLGGEVTVLMHAGKVEEAMLQCRRDEKDFLLKKKMKYQKRLHKHVATIKREAAAIVENMARYVAMKGMTAEAREIQGEADIYLKNFDILVKEQVAAGLDENSGYHGQFRQAAAGLEQNLLDHELGDVYTSYLLLRWVEKSLYRVNSDSNVKDFKQALADFTDTVSASKCDAVAKKQIQEALTAYQAAANKFITSAAKLVKAVQYHKVRKAAATMETAIKSVNVPGALRLMSAIRISEKNYILRHKKEDFTKTHEAVDNLYNAFVRAGVLQEHVDDVKSRLDVYTKNFDALAAAYGRIKKAITIVHNTAHKIEPLAASIYQKANQNTDNESLTIVAKARSLAYTAVAVGLIIMVITLVIAIFLARSITRPVNAIIQKLTSGAERVSATSNQVASSSQTMAEGASEQAAAIEETSATMEEMASMTKQNSENSLQADDLMKDTMKVIREADEAMGNISDSMGEISSASAETQKIVKTIDEIAFQTNLLALNAAVEAARAGEAGAGFAVVADEVRNLAMRAAEAAKNTAALIDDTVIKVNNGKVVVDHANESFSNVTEASTKIGALLGEIASASQEQDKGFAQINQAITEMDSVTQQNAAVAEESAGAAAEMTSQAAVMMASINQLKAMIEGSGRQAGSSVAPPKTTPSRRSLPEAVKPAQPRPKAIPAIPPPPPASNNPADVIPMDDDDDFEDF